MLNVFKNNFYMLRFVSKYAPELFFAKIVLVITGLIVNFGFNVVKAEVKNIVQTGTNLARIQFSIAEKLKK